jgi:PAS domain S-box-containing protein
MLCWTRAGPEATIMTNLSSTSEKPDVILPSGFGLGPRELDSVFPFHFVIDSDTRVIRAGPAIHRLLPDLAGGKKFDSLFRIKHPANLITYEEICEHSDQLFLLEARSLDKLLLKGQMLYLPHANAIVFIGAPWLADSSDINVLGLSLNDFAIHDSVPDYLLLLHTLKTSLGDARVLAEQLNAMNRQLEKRIEERTQEVISANATLTETNRRLLQEITERKLAEALERRQFNELQAIYQISNAVRGAESLEQVYERAMESILLALKVDRVAILLLDAAGVMRFVAWRGLSDTYREAADAHSPWTQATVDPQPILVDDIELDADWARFLPVARVEGISALGFIPLVLHGHLFGKFMVYFNQPHHFTGDEARLAQTIAFHITYAIERKRAEMNLAESEARYRALFEQGVDPIWLLDAQTGAIVDFNTAAHESLGYTREEFARLTIADLDTVGSPQENALHMMVSAKDSDVFETAHRTKHGELRHILISVKSITFGGTTYFQSVQRDITERKEYEAELKRSNAELEQFSYAVSHDMRQPLRMISSYLQLLEIGLAGQLDSEKRGYFGFAIEGAKRIDQMLVALLEYSRVGKAGERAAWIESRAVLDEALQFLQPAIDEAHARVSIEGDWPRVLVSHDEVLRLLQNLVGNAVKYHIAGRTPEITVASEVTKNEWRLCVADNGVGIIPDQIKRLFQVFQRLQTRTAYEGTGIGLALCRKIAEHHKGRIWAESAGEGLGSKFCVVLPVLREKI